MVPTMDAREPLDASEVLGEIMSQELRRVGRLEVVDSDDGQDEAVMLAMRRGLMRAYHAGQADLAAALSPQGVQVHLEPTLVDEHGVDLLLPPVDPA